MLAQINATAKAYEASTKLSPEERAKRRVEVSHRIAALPRVGQAIWSAQSTMTLSGTVAVVLRSAATGGTDPPVRRTQ